MSSKFSNPGAVQTFTAPGGGVTVDVPVLIGSLVVIPLVSAAAGASFEGALEGVFRSMPKATGAAWTEGLVLYFDSADSTFKTAASATARRAATAVVAAASGDTTGTLRLLNISAAVNVA
jgi:predicted RecA/RadA family phage recombinase